MNRIFTMSIIRTFGIVLLSAIGIFSDVAQLTNYNIVDTLKNSSPWSYWVVALAIIVYFLLDFNVSLFKRKEVKAPVRDEAYGRKLKVTRNKTKELELEKFRKKLRQQITTSKIFIHDLGELLQIIVSVYESNEEDFERFEKRYAILKERFLSNIDIIEEDFSSFIIDTEYKIGGGLYQNPYKWDNKPLSRFLGQHSILEVIHTIAPKPRYSFDDDRSSRIQRSTEQVDKVKSRLHRFLSHLKNSIDN